MRRLLLPFVMLAAIVAAGPALAAEASADIVKRWEPYIILVGVPFIVQGVKKYLVPSIPGQWLPVIAGAIGPGLDQLHAWLAGVQGSPAVATIAALAGVGVRELLNQWSADSAGRGGLLPK